MIRVLSLLKSIKFKRCNNLRFFLQKIVINLLLQVLHQHCLWQGGGDVFRLPCLPSGMFGLEIVYSFLLFNHQCAWLEVAWNRFVIACSNHTKPCSLPQSLTLAEVYRVVSALQLRPAIAWKEFRTRYHSVADLLITRYDDTAILRWKIRITRKIVLPSWSCGGRLDLESQVGSHCHLAVEDKNHKICRITLPSCGEIWSSPATTALPSCGSVRHYWLNFSSFHISFFCRSDGSLMFFHPTFRDWLVKRPEGEGTKFLCDVRTGHAAIAFSMAR